MRTAGPVIVVLEELFQTPYPADPRHKAIRLIRGGRLNPLSICRGRCIVPDNLIRPPTGPGKARHVLLELFLLKTELNCGPHQVLL